MRAVLMTVVAIVLLYSSNVFAGCDHGQSKGDPHFDTFDGFGYSFHGLGDYLLVEWPESGDWIQTRHVPFDGICRGIAINGAVAVRIGDHTVGVAAEPFRVLIDDEAVDAKKGVDARWDEGTVKVTESVVEITWSHGAEVRLYHRGSRIDVSASPGSSPVRGMLGNADGDRTNDMEVRNGPRLLNALTFEALYSWFGASYQLNADESILDDMFGEPLSSDPDLDWAKIHVENLRIAEEFAPEARVICEQAGVSPDHLDFGRCMFDVACTQDPNAADSFTEDVPPVVELRLLKPEYHCWLWVYRLLGFIAALLVLLISLVRREIRIYGLIYSAALFAVATLYEFGIVSATLRSWLIIGWGIAFLLVAGRAMKRARRRDDES